MVHPQLEQHAPFPPVLKSASAAVSLFVVGFFSRTVLIFPTLCSKDDRHCPPECGRLGLDGSQKRGNYRTLQAPQDICECFARFHTGQACECDCLKKSRGRRLSSDTIMQMCVCLASHTTQVISSFQNLSTFFHSCSQAQT